MYWFGFLWTIHQTTLSNLVGTSLNILLLAYSGMRDGFWPPLRSPLWSCSIVWRSCRPKTNVEAKLPTLFTYCRLLCQREDEVVYHLRATNPWGEARGGGGHPETGLILYGAICRRLSEIIAAAIRTKSKLLCILSSRRASVHRHLRREKGVCCVGRCSFGGGGA